MSPTPSVRPPRRSGASTNGTIVRVAKPAAAVEVELEWYGYEVPDRIL
jgi:hypothetical protein